MPICELEAVRKQVVVVIRVVVAHGRVPAGAAAAWAAPPSPSPEPVTTGDSRGGVNFENLPASMRSWKRVGLGRLLDTFSRRDTAAGTFTTSLRLAGPASRTRCGRRAAENHCVPPRFDLKFLPRDREPRRR